MLSMTGFGRGEASGAAGSAVVQISSVNHRQCQVHVRCEVRDLGIEDEIRRTVKDAAQRGALTVQVQWSDPIEDTAVDHAGLVHAYQHLAAAAKEAGAPQPSLVDAQRYVTAEVSEEDDGEAKLSVIRSAVENALEAHTAMREQEGNSLVDHLGRLRADLGQLQASMKTVAESRLEAWTQRFQDRLKELLGEDPPLDEQVLAREVALQSDRIDVSEEMERLVSHFKIFDDILADSSGEPLGKRLEFLAQELGREINTTGSKANDAELTKLVMEAKNVLEQVREQAANVL